MESVVTDGYPDAGQTLGQLVQKYGSRLVGEKVSRLHGKRFPLLMKIIDAQRDLSLQVHPDDDLARRRSQPCGKTEMWYVLDAAPDASIYCGFSRKTNYKEVVDRVGDNTVMELVDTIPSRPGQVFFVPAGTVHAIGAGNLVIEIQQSSDLTYRLYDYNRLDKQGRPRQLHLDEAEEAIDFSFPGRFAHKGTVIDTTCRRMIDSEYFKADFINLDTPGDTFAFDTHGETFAILLVVEGSFEVVSDSGSVDSCARGFSLLVPAETGRFQLTGEGKGLLFYC